ncbi:hypothetical protein [Adhaeribacter soli]|uniref:Outer membrane beta-barrel protein n=1 Tax=Adhaeribacter soli TaxID=2607655 RepID=A0A5N1J0Q9_9BACT|nr:hypothetical protein [Adhaeribacter soli]KAA9339978.1 hypothetical protein F0P94_06400 [Adhaeribacter soli]
MKLFSPGIFLISALLLASSCTAPRSVIHSGKVTPKGEFKAGANFSGNIATQPIAALSEGTKNLVNTLKEQKTYESADAVADVSRAVLAYTLDPASPSFDFYGRYGLAKRVDVGYKYAFGTHVFDGMFQFMGSTGTIKNPGPEGTYGSIGLQFSSRSADLPGKFLLEDAGKLLKFDASRTDILIPLVFSTSFGPEETYGNISYGLAYSRSFVKYNFDPSEFLVQQAGQQNYVPVEKVSGKESYGALGAFVNAKIGYKYAYVLPVLAIYYQNYGKYNLPGGRQTELKGFTFIPSLGLQFNFGGGR